MAASFFLWPQAAPQHWRVQGVRAKLPLASRIFSLCLAWTRLKTTSASVRRPPVRTRSRPSPPSIEPLLRMVPIKYVRTFPWRSLTCRENIGSHPVAMEENVSIFMLIHEQELVSWWSIYVFFFKIDPIYRHQGAMLFCKLRYVRECWVWSY